MSTETITTLTDDINGKENAQRVTFAVNGTNYEIDLAGVNLLNFNRSLAKYIEAGREIKAVEKKARKPRGERAEKPATQASIVRQWARDNGLTVGARGRIHPDILAAFNAANGVAAPAPEIDAEAQAQADALADMEQDALADA